MDTIYKKLKVNFAMHSPEGLKYLRECYDIILNMHSMANQPMDVTFEEYCIMYSEAINAYGYDHTHNGLHIYDKEKLKVVEKELMGIDDEPLDF